jgi:hypothetical protein
MSGSNRGQISKDYLKWDGVLFGLPKKTVSKVSPSVHPVRTKRTPLYAPGVHHTTEVYAPGVHREPVPKVSPGVHTKSYHLPQGGCPESAATSRDAADDAALSDVHAGPPILPDDGLTIPTFLRRG